MVWIVEKKAVHHAHLNLASLENSIDNTARKEITAYLRDCGFLKEGTDPDALP